MFNLQGMLLGGVALAAISGFAASQVQRGWDQNDCSKKIEAVKKASAKLIDAKLQEILTVEAERDQARAEVAKVNASTAQQLADIQKLLADDQVKREEASARVEAAAKEAARNAKAAGDRAQAARDLMATITDKCAGAGVPDDVLRMLNGILDPAAKAGVGDRSMPSGAGQGRP